MSHLTFEQDWERYLKTNKAWNPVAYRPQREDAFISGWHARDAEIADLKRQVVLAQAQVAVVDRGLHDLGDTSAQAALDAYVQEKVSARDMEWWQALALVDNVAPTPEAVKDWLLRLKAYEVAAQAVLAESEWWAERQSDMYAGEKSNRLAANRAKVAVTPAGPPKESR